MRLLAPALLLLAACDPLLLPPAAGGPGGERVDAPAVVVAAARDPYLLGGGVAAVYLTDPGVAPGQGLDPAADDAVVAAIDGAEVSVEMAAYDFDRGPIVEAVLAAVARGVEVRFVGDGDEADDLGYVRLAEAGVRMALRRPGSHIMHHKFVVIDRRVVLTGSMNFSENDILRNDNDLVVIEDEALAARYAAEHEQMFSAGRFGRQKLPSAPASPAALGAEVYFGPQDAPGEALRRALATADHRVQFLVFSFTHGDIRDDLLALSAAGVEVAGVMDRGQAAGRYSVDEALVAGGVSVLIDGNENQQGFAGGKLHHKLLLIDAGTDSQPMVLTGSMNWSGAGTRDNDENLLVLRGAEAVAPYLEAFCRAVDRATPHPAHAAPPPDPCRAVARDVRITALAPRAAAGPGADFVALTNVGRRTIDLTGWQVGTEAAPAARVLGPRSLAPGETVPVPVPLDDHFGTARLADRAGVLVDRRLYRGARPGEVLPAW